MPSAMRGDDDDARPRLLFLDAYDSFANNIVALLATLLGADVHVLPIDAPLSPAAFRQELRCYDAVVCGPGPGSPDNPADIGLMRHVWEKELWGDSGEQVTPALGICLGFQSLVASHGGRIRRLRSGGLHGMVRVVEAQPSGTASDRDGDDDCSNIFAGVASAFRATLYHSLGADIGQDHVPDDDWPTARWKPLPPVPPISSSCSNLVPLAWIEEPLEVATGEGYTAERILMGVRHRHLPFWGLQYHPESVCTDAASHAVLANWLRAALKWNADHDRRRPAVPLGSDGAHVSLVARQATRPSLLSLHPRVFGESHASYPPTNSMNGTNGTNGNHKTNGANGNSKDTTPICKMSAFAQCFACRAICLPEHVQVPDIVEALTCRDDSPCSLTDVEPEHIIFDSASAAASNAATASLLEEASIDDDAIRGRFSIMALNVGSALRIEYRTGDNFATIRLPAGSGFVQKSVPLRGTQSIWQLLAEFHEARRLPREVAPASSSSASPFLGGFMGYVTYEQGLADIGVELAGGAADRGHDRPDICFAWVTQSIVVDHVLGTLHVQHLCDKDASLQNSGSSGRAHSPWVDDIVARLQNSALWQKVTKAKQAEPSSAATATAILSKRMPNACEYENKVRACRKHIAAGDSYELCLTDQTHVEVVTSSPQAFPLSTSWQYFRRLRTRNPAPFASYIRLGGATLVSSSPERFLCFGPDRGQGGDSGLVCSMRPMKGTVRRSAAVATLAQAEAVLHIPKEEAENLMIVDLVRHDLHGVCGPGAVSVPHLLQVEPYGHVFQMVSVVEGRLGGGSSSSSSKEDSDSQRRLGAPHTGLDVLAASLPPGSMTGAPKKRSCELLGRIEQGKERSLYSGVVGYLCATGRGDWSVTIRSLFRWDDETTARTDAAGKQVERKDVWHMGAGGAVTILSTAEGERDEMFTKLAGPMSVFGE